MPAVRHASHGAATRPAGPIDRVFVYGSLRTGQSARHLIEPFVVAWEPATVRGELFGFPSGYPAVILAPDAGLVMGELLVLRDLPRCLPVLDAYEGVDYVREAIQVHHVGGPSWAWIYVLADPRATALGTHVPSGEWLTSSLPDLLDQPTR
jgi:gamma-glutamylcyclotransferase (GGCT)/AIG2-like uncharacterized protein YtfP